MPKPRTPSELTALAQATRSGAFDRRAFFKIAARSGVTAAAAGAMIGFTPAQTSVIHAAERAQGDALASHEMPRFSNQPAPEFSMPETSMPPDLAYNMVHGELFLDGNTRLNLASFVTTWMEDQAQNLISESADKNMIDKDEYPQTAEIEQRCVNILADLWHSPQCRPATGCSTIGSSEACMLGGLALKWKWRERRKAAGLPVDRPNMVMGANVQVCWEKFCRYWDVEPRHVPMEDDRYHMTAQEAVALCDENTIGVVAIFGSTFDGSYEDVKEISGAGEAERPD